MTYYSNFELNEMNRASVYEVAKDLAREYSLTGVSKLKKAELIELVLKYQEDPQKEEVWQEANQAFDEVDYTSVCDSVGEDRYITKDEYDDYYNNTYSNYDDMFASLSSAQTNIDQHVEIIQNGNPNYQTVVLDCDEEIEEQPYEVIPLLISGIQARIDSYEYGYKPFIDWNNNSNYERVDYDVIPGNKAMLFLQLRDLIQFMQSDLRPEVIKTNNPKLGFTNPELLQKMINTAIIYKPKTLDQYTDALEINSVLKMVYRTKEVLLMDLHYLNYPYGADYKSRYEIKLSDNSKVNASGFDNLHKAWHQACREIDLFIDGCWKSSGYSEFYPDSLLITEYYNYPWDTELKLQMTKRGLI